MRKSLCVLLCIILIFFTGCGNKREVELPKDVRAISTKWQDDQLLYATSDGIFTYSPADGRTENLMSDDISKKDINWLNCNLSPDKSKYIVITMGHYDNTVEIRDSETGQSILQLDVDKYREGVGGYSPPVGQVEWLDNDNIFLSTEFRLFIINIKTGDEVQVTEECSPVTTKVSPNTEAPYLSWAFNVKKMGDKLYYYSKRKPKAPGLGSIYYGYKTGEHELLKNAWLLLAVDDKRFVYLKETKPDVTETFLYDISIGSSSLITAERCLEEGIFRTNEGKLVFMTGDMTGGIYQGVVYNPDTRQSQIFDIYNGERDFPNEDIDKRQFGHFMGAFEKDEECVFLFSVENYSKPQGKYIKEYLAYSTKSNKLIKIDDYGDTWLVNMSISPSGDYIVVTKHNRPGDDDFLFDVLKSDNLLRQLQ
jgi:WD40 repeat protein